MMERKEENIIQIQQEVEVSAQQKSDQKSEYNHDICRNGIDSLIEISKNRNP
jgi:hypothetical protein